MKPVAAQVELPSKIRAKWIQLFCVWCVVASTAYGQAPAVEGVCSLMRSLTEHSGQTVAVEGEVFGVDGGLVIGEPTCMPGFSYQFTRWPSVVNLVPARGGEGPARELVEAITADRREGRYVVARGTFVGTLRTRADYRLTLVDGFPAGNAFGPRGAFPAELVFGEIRDLSVQLEPPPNELDVIPVCDVLDDLSSYSGRRLAIRGIRVRGPNGDGLIGECETPVVVAGTSFPAAIHLSSDAVALMRVVGLDKRPLAVPDEPTDTPLGRRHVKRTGTYIGRLMVKDRFPDGVPPQAAGYGDLLRFPAQLQLEAIRDVVLEPVDSELREPELPAHLRQRTVRRAAPEECQVAGSLLEASTAGCIDRVREFLSAGADVDRRASNGKTPLLMAIFRSHNDIVELLLDHGASAGSVWHHWTPLCQAADSKNPQAIRMLLAHGANANPSPGDCVPVDRAAQYGPPETLKALLAVDGIKLEARNEFGETALLSAAHRNRPENVRLLLKAGADPDATNEDGETAIVRYRYHAEVVAELIRGGANIEATTKEGATALMLAAQGARLDSVRALIEGGADVSRRDSKGSTPLMYAVQGGYADAISLLLAAGADVNARNDAGQTAHDLVSDKNATHILKTLQR